MTGSDRPFRFGLQVARAQSRAAWHDEARRAEDLGFDTIVVPDHIADELLSPMVALATMAEATTTLRVGTFVLNNDFRHPAHRREVRGVLAVEAFGQAGRRDHADPRVETRPFDSSCLDAHALDGAHEAPVRRGRVGRIKEGGSSEVGFGWTQGSQHPVDDDPSIGADDHIPGVQVEVAQVAGAVVEAFEQREQLADEHGRETAHANAARQARDEVGQTRDGSSIQRLVQRGPRRGECVEVGRRRDDRRENRAVDPIHHHPVTTVDDDRLVGMRCRDPGRAHDRQCRRLHHREAVPLGTVELEHPSVAPREHLGRAARRNRLHRGGA